MSEINQEETQQELFVEFAGAEKKQERFLPPTKVNKPILLSTSAEQIILVSITLILVCCFIFFLGVLRGKALGANRVADVSQEKLLARPAAPAKSAPVGTTAHSLAPVATIAEPKVGANSNKVQESWVAGKPYTIQVATYKKQDLAEKEAVALRRSGYYSAIVPSNGYFTVCVGQYAAKEDAKKDLKILGAKYKGCFLRGH